MRAPEDRPEPLFGWYTITSIIGHFRTETFPISFAARCCRGGSPGRGAGSRLALESQHISTAKDARRSLA
jgi:hypothetical protein